MIVGFASIKAQETSFLCAGTTKTLTASATGGTAPITYVWTSPSSVATTGATVSADAAGTWTWEATDANGCTATGTHVVNIEANPNATITAVDVCLNSAQNISATGVPAGYEYSWGFGAGATPATSSTATTSVSYSTTGSKTITLTVTRVFTGTTNGCSETCTWTSTATINVGELAGTSSCN